MLTRSARRTLGIGSAVIAMAIFGGILADAYDERTDIRAHAAEITRGDPHRGEMMFIAYGCGSCHGVKHVRKATGMVGPPLDGIALRAVLAGRLENRPDNMQRWIRDPQAVSPGTAMPDLNVGERDARDISAFLYTRAE
jgi:cytochrome c2